MIDTVKTSGTGSGLDLRYSQLEVCLQQGLWKQADLETTQILLTLANCPEDTAPRPHDITLIPAAALKTIDTLWNSHSHSRFGFTAQRRAWYESNHNYTIFGDLVGWRNGGSWLGYDQLIFDQSAQPGHLPALKFVVSLAGGEPIFSFVLGKWRIALLSRNDF